MKERKRIGAGNEHIVYEAKNPNFVLKKQRLRNKILMRISRTSVSDIREELQNAYKIAENTPIKILPTRLFARDKTSYTLVQPRLHPDTSADPDTIITNQKSHLLKIRYQSNPANFVMQDKTLYWVDVTKAPIIRFVNKHTPIDEYAYRRITATGRKVIRSVGKKVVSMLRSS